MRNNKTIGTLSFCCLLLASVFVSGCDAGNAAPLRVIKVFDGDTVLLSSGEKVRLIGIDCPEAYESDKLFRDAKRSGQDIRVIQQQGRRAGAFTRQVAAGKKILLDFDVEQRDKYGRLLAYAYIPRRELPEGTLAGQLYETEYNGEPCYFLNASVVKAGYASPMTIPPNVKHADLFKRLYESARVRHVGLWSPTQ